LRENVSASETFTLSSGGDEWGKLVDKIETMI